MQSFSQGEALSHTGATRNELTHWTDSRIIVADITEAGGRGRHRRFSFANLVQIRVAHEISAFQVPGVRLWEIVFVVKRALESGASLIRFEPNGFLFLGDVSTTLDGMDTTEIALIINVTTIAADLARRTGEPLVGQTPTQEDLNRAARSAKKRLDQGRSSK